ncbi:Uncharacterised protein [Chlamydia trachomatis]|nr:Uncharacterised protein [Chlamydia trachomatis]
MPAKKTPATKTVAKESTTVKKTVEAAPVKKEAVKKTTTDIKATTTKKAEEAKKATPAKKAAATKAEPAKKSEAPKATATKAEPAKKAEASKPAAKKAEEAKKATPANKAAATKAEPAKKSEAPKATATKAEPAKKAEASKPAAKKAEEVKKAPAKKTTTKKAAPKKTTTAKKAEPAKKEAAAKKAEEVKKAAPAKKTASKKAAPKKTATKAKAAPKKAAVKKASPAKKPSASKTKKEKLEQYNNFAIDTCLEMAKAMGVAMDYDAYAAMLLDSDNIKQMAKDVLAKYNVDAKAFSFEKDGYDTDLIEVIFNRISETVDIKASDFKDIAKDIKTHAQYEIQDDATANNEEYQKDFDLVREVLMIGQRKNIHSTEDMKAFVKEDPTDLIGKFMDLALQVLPLFEYDDVKYYENFIYAVLSQFDNLHQKWGTRALMDVADLYIKHGDYGLGDANYNYVLRENEIKDMIYYRFANVYVGIDLDKAKAIANSSFQYVDDRYDYYPKIIEILEK